MEHLFCLGNVLESSQEALQYLQVLGWLTEQVTPDCRHPQNNSSDHEDEDYSDSEDESINNPNANAETQVMSSTTIRY